MSCVDSDKIPPVVVVPAELFADHEVYIRSVVTNCLILIFDSQFLIPVVSAELPANFCMIQEIAIPPAGTLRKI